jgi:ankyrin repeat protein
MPVTYTDHVRGLTWTEDVWGNATDTALLEAAANGEMARAQALVSYGTSNLPAACSAAKANGHAALGKWLEETMWGNAARKLREMR